MLRPTTNPARVLGEKTKAAQAQADTANAVDATRPYQTNSKVAAAIAELNKQAAELLVHAGLLDEHGTEIGINTGNISELLARLANAAIYTIDSFYGRRGTKGSPDWWDGARPQVTAMSLSGKFRIVYGGIMTDPDDPDAGDGTSWVSFSGDGVDRNDNARRVSTWSVQPSQVETIVTKAPGTTLTVQLEWTQWLQRGWIILQPLL